MHCRAERVGGQDARGSLQPNGPRRRAEDNGSNEDERDILALNKCSAFKVQKIIPVENADGDAEVHCLGASGYSTLFKRVTRMTAKLSDVPNSTQDPLVRWCLAGPTAALN